MAKREKVRPYISDEIEEMNERAGVLSSEFYDDLVTLRDKAFKLSEIYEELYNMVLDEEDYVKENLDKLVKTRMFLLNDYKTNAKDCMNDYRQLLDKIEKLIEDEYDPVE